MQLEMLASQMNAHCVNSLLTIYTEQSGGRHADLQPKRTVTPLVPPESD